MGQVVKQKGIIGTTWTIHDEQGVILIIRSSQTI